MNKQKTILIIIILFSLAGNIFLGYKYSVIKEELEAAKANFKNQQTSEKVLEFTKLFVEKVLKAEKEVDFETRLKLENAVRNLGDEEILAQWNRFIDSKTEADAQNEVKNLLAMLVGKIYPVE